MADLVVDGSADETIDCRVYQEEGGQRLVFMVNGTTHCVGEIHIKADDRYLRTIGQLFSHYVEKSRSSSGLASSIRNALVNGSAHRRRG